MTTYRLGVDRDRAGPHDVGRQPSRTRRVHDAHGDVVASLSVSGSTYRLTPEVLGAVAEQVVTAAGEASLAMGWHGPDPGTGAGTT